MSRDTGTGMLIASKHLAVLRRLVEAEDAENYDEAEIVCERRSCWIDCDRVPRRLVDDLLRCMCLRDVSDTGGLTRYAVNETGRAVMKDPRIADALVIAVMSGQPVTIVDGTVVPMTPYGP